MPFCSASRSRRAAGALVLAVALQPEAAAAHSPFPGIKGFYTGLLHPLSSAAQVLALIALGLVFSQWWPRRFGLALPVFAVACLAGMILGQTGAPVAWAEPSLLAVALAAGALAALWPACPGVFAIAAAGIAGALIGLVSTPDPGPLRATLITLAGSLVGAGVALLYSAGGLGWLYERIAAVWVRIGFRIAAAWTATIAALLLALRLANPD